MASSPFKTVNNEYSETAEEGQEKRHAKTEYFQGIMMQNMDNHKPGEQKRYPSTEENKAGEEQPFEALMNHGSPAWHCEINSPLIRDFIVLTPQLPARRQWTRQDFEQTEKILRTVYRNFRGDPDRTSLTGFSYGAKAVFDFAVWAEELSEKDSAKKLTWAALWPVDEANNEARSSCTASRVWLHFGSWKPDLQKRTAGNLGLARSEPFRKEYPKADRLYTDYTPFGYDHITTCEVSYADWRAYEWLLNS